jgi:hypothetical protein
MKMKPVVWRLLTVPVILSLIGCARITSQVVEKDRVDQEMEGNRGYLTGSSPAPAAHRKAKRKMIQTDIELPTARELNPWQVSKAPAAAPAPAVPPAAPAPVEDEGILGEDWEEPVAEEAPAPVPAPQPAEAATPYTVAKGDTLEKIAAKFYGDSKKWRGIYEANRDVLKSPNRIYPGQKLMIPADQEGPVSSGDLK